MKTAIIAAVLLACTALPGVAAAELLRSSEKASPAEPVRVIDGDTIDLAGQRIRLWGIDAPERSQTCDGRNGDIYLCGMDSTAVLRELTNNRTVICTERGNDRYKRTVAICRTEAGEINAAMVRRGWAVDYTKYSHGAYKTEEAAARAEGLGIWSGRFTLPDEYRRSKRGPR